MDSEFQPMIINYCRHCEEPLYDSQDWDKPRWGTPLCGDGDSHEAMDEVDMLTTYKW